MSPEQAKGAALDGRSDLFAVGCILYEMIAGKKAFRGDSITGLIFKIITEEPPPIREMSARRAGRDGAHHRQGAGQDPDARYQTGRELADDLLGLTRAGIDADAAAIGDGDRGRRPARSATVITPATLKGAAVTRVAPPAPPRRPCRPPRPPPPARPPPSPRRPPRRRRDPNTGLMLALVAGGLFIAVAVAFTGWFLFVRKAEQAVATNAGVRDRSRADPELAARERHRGAQGRHPRARAGGAGAARVRSRPAPDHRGRDSGRGRPARPPRRPRTASTRAAAADPAPPAESEYGFLDEEAAAGDGREAGERLAGTYRTQGGQTSSGSFGASGRFKARERSPRGLSPAERPAVATIRHLIDRMEAFHRRNRPVCRARRPARGRARPRRSRFGEHLPAPRLRLRGDGRVRRLPHHRHAGVAERPARSWGTTPATSAPAWTS